MCYEALFENKESEAKRKNHLNHSVGINDE